MRRLDSGEELNRKKISPNEESLFWPNLLLIVAIAELRPLLDVLSRREVLRYLAKTTGRGWIRSDLFIIQRWPFAYLRLSWHELRLQMISVHP